VEILPERNSNLYTLYGELSDYNIDIIDGSGNVYSNLDTDGESISVDIDDLPAGSFLIKVSDPTNNQMVVEKIIKL